MGESNRRISFLEAKDAIEQSRCIQDLLGIGVMPEMDISDDYFFISYSHADYKKVYVDLIGLAKEGVAFWYDRGMTPGKDWEETAEHYLSKFRCRGVLLYLSETSLNSKAVLKEIENANLYGKPVIPVMLVKVENGLSSTIRNLVDSEEIKKRLLSALPDSLIYLDVDSSFKSKAEKFELAKDNASLFAYQLYTDFNTSNDGVAYTLMSVNDSEVVKLNLPTLVEDFWPLVGVEKAALANFSHLRQVNGPALRYIFEFAFYNCTALKGVCLHEFAYIGRYAFANCSSLEEVIFEKNPKDTSDYAFVPYRDSLFNRSSAYDDGPVCEIGDFAFYACMGLSDFVCPSRCTRIGKMAFNLCSSLSRIALPDGLKRIEEGAFMTCESLRKLVIPDSVEYIGPEAFSNCFSLESIVLPKGLKEIPESCFYQCSNLREVIIDLESLEKVGDSAFENCRGLILDLSSSKASVGKDAFRNCKNVVVSD